MEIAICDDEKEIRVQIRDLIRKAKVSGRITGYRSGVALLAAEKRFDLIFLDIQMADGNGIETARALRVRKEEAVLIFITGLREYVFEAFDVSAFHYLLKPIEEGKFTAVLARATAEIVRKKQASQQPPLLLKAGKRNLSVNRPDIFYLENRARKVEIHTVAENIEIYATMDKLAEQLGGGFFRCHRGYLVNLAHVAEFDTGSIRLSNGETVYLAKDRYREFAKAWLRYVRNGGGSGV